MDEARTEAVLDGGQVDAVSTNATTKRWVPVWLPLAVGAASLAIIVASFFAGAFYRLPFSVHRPSWSLEEVRWPAMALSLPGLGGTVWALVLAVRVTRQRQRWLAAAGFVQVLGALWLMFVGGVVALINATGGFSRGRQLRSLGRLQLPPLGRGTGWLTDAVLAHAEAPEAGENRQAIADQWRANGRTEHASVAAFARLSLDLLGLGAPARLLTAAQQDGMDEIRHAEACFSLASAIDGRTFGPDAFPAAARAKPRSRVRSWALIELAIDSLLEGALHEGFSARVLAKLAKRCQHPQVRPMLARIAQDEGRHAAHAWDVLAWCLEEGGLPVRAALAGALAFLSGFLSGFLSKEARSSQPEAARGGAWERYGIHGEELEVECVAQTREAVVRQARRLLEERRWVSLLN